MRVNRFAVFDTETTGLPFHRQAPIALQPKIIEFAGLITDGVEIFDTLEFICNPHMQIEPIITQITGLVQSDLDDKPPFAHFLPQVVEFFSKADASVAHNHSFDSAMLRYEAQRIGLDYDTFKTPQIAICTVEQLYPIYGKGMRLIDLFTKHCGPYVQKHRALDDVKVLHRMAMATGVYEAYQSQGDQE